jgi:hypothetical protein
MSTTKDFAMLGPCPQCPFRTDVKPFITTSRASSILRSVIRGESFHCHKTIKHTEDGDHAPSRDDRLCAGAVIIARKEGALYRNQMARIAERLGADFDEIRESAPVYADAAAMIYAHKNRTKASAGADEVEEQGEGLKARSTPKTPKE